MRISEAQAKVLLGQFYIAPNNKTPKQKRPKQPSAGEMELIRHLHAHKIPYEREFKFAQHRRWRADFLITGTRILIEVEGGIFSNGRHTRGTGYTKDCEKYNWAASNNWLLLRFTTGQVNSGDAVKVVLEAIKNNEVKKHG